MPALSINFNFAKTSLKIDMDVSLCPDFKFHFPKIDEYVTFLWIKWILDKLIAIVT